MSPLPEYGNLDPWYVHLEVVKDYLALGMMDPDREAAMHLGVALVHALVMMQARLAEIGQGLGGA